MSDAENPKPPGDHPPQNPANPNAPPATTDIVRYGNPQELAPHEAMVATPEGNVPRDVLVRRGASKAAIVTSVALVIIGAELGLMAGPGVALIYFVIVLPVMVYILRITRRPIENESPFRRAMATTGTTVLTVLGALAFLFMSFATIIFIICSGSHL